MCLNVALESEVVAAVTSSVNGGSQEAVLLHSLLANYDKRIRPTLNSSAPITVYVQFVLTKVERLVG